MISQAKFDELRSRMESMRKSAMNARARVAQEAETFTRSAATMGSAFALGVVNGRFDSPEILGVPVDLGVAVAGHMLAFSGSAGSQKELVHAVADGAGAAFLTLWGVGAGQSMRGSRAAGALPYRRQRGSGGDADSVIRRMIEARR